MAHYYYQFIKVDLNWLL